MMIIIIATLFVLFGCTSGARVLTQKDWQCMGALIKCSKETSLFTKGFKLYLMNQNVDREMLTEFCSDAMPHAKSCYNGLTALHSVDCPSANGLFDSFESMCDNEDELYKYLQCGFELRSADRAPEDSEKYFAPARNCFSEEVEKYYGGKPPTSYSVKDMVSILTSCGVMDAAQKCVTPVIEHYCPDQAAGYIPFFRKNLAEKMNPAAAECD